MNKWKVIFLFALLTSCLADSRANALSCVFIPVEDDFKNSDVVFYGTVITALNSSTSKFEVEKVFKGSVLQQVTVNTVSHKPGGKTVIFGFYDEKGNIIQNACTSSFFMEPEDIMKSLGDPYDPIPYSDPSHEGAVLLVSLACCMTAAAIWRSYANKQKRNSA